MYLAANIIMVEWWSLVFTPVYCAAACFVVVKDIQCGPTSMLACEITGL